MKKTLTILLLLAFCMVGVGKVEAEPEENYITGTYGTYETAKKIVKEVMLSYYQRGDSVQYNHPKNKYGQKSPEEGTSQDILYQVCSSYVYNVYSEAFGMTNANSGFPLYTSSVQSQAKKYYNENKDDPNKMNGSFLIYYETNNGTTTIDEEEIPGNESGDEEENEPNSDYIRYVYGEGENEITASEFINNIQIGDYFIIHDHALIA